MSLSIPFATRQAFKYSIDPSDKYFTVYTHQQLIIDFLDGRVAKSQVSF